MRKMKKNKRVSFGATKRIPRKVKVSFRDVHGERVSFVGTARVPQKIKVKFWASTKGKRLRRRKNEEDDKRIQENGEELATPL